MGIHRDKTKQAGSQGDLLERVRSLKAEENMRRVIEELSKIPFSAPKGYSTESLREDRDSN